MTPLLCVVAINYNTAADTIEMVDSVIKSDYPNLRIIVVDNCSTLEDYEKLNVIKDRAVVIRSERNSGFSGGNNIGLHYAQQLGAKYVMLLNSDTAINKKAIRAMVACLESGEADVACPKILNYYNREEIGYAGGELRDYKGAVWIRGIRQKDKSQYEEKTQITFVSGCCVLMDMQTWEQVNFMEEKYFLYFEDTALSAALRRAGKKMLYVPQAVVYHKESVSTGKRSDNYQYYFCRNRLLYSKDNISQPIRLIAYGYTGLYIIKKVIKGTFSWGNVYAAIRDFLQGNFGERH